MHPVQPIWHTPLANQSDLPDGDMITTKKDYPFLKARTRPARHPVSVETHRSQQDLSLVCNPCYWNWSPSNASTFSRHLFCLQVCWPAAAGSSSTTAYAFHHNWCTTEVACKGQFLAAYVYTRCSQQYDSCGMEAVGKAAYSMNDPQLGVGCI